MPPPHLPVDIWSLIIRSAAADAGGLHGLAPIFNLVCNAAHSALPEAFAQDDADDGDEPSAAFSAEVCGTWPPAATTAITVPVLHLSLDRLADAVFQDGAQGLSESLRRTGVRFARARSVRLVVQYRHGPLASALFFKHAAQHMVAVRRLFILDACTREHSTPWAPPAFAAFAAGARELSVVGHHSSLAPLAEELPTRFPHLTAVHLAITTDPYARCHFTGSPHWHEEDETTAKQRGEFCDLTVAAPPHLHSLLVAFTVPDDDRGHPLYAYLKEGTHWYEDEPLTVSVAGEPDRLQRLHIHTGGPHDHGRRPWRLDGHLPALRTLDATVAPHTTFPFGWAQYSTPTRDDETLGDMCPAVNKLVLRMAKAMRYREGGKDVWDAAAGAMARMSDSLERVELHFLSWADASADEYAAARASMAADKARLLAEAAEWRAEASEMLDSGESELSDSEGGDEAL